MDKKQYSYFKKSIQKIRQAIVEMKGPLDGISYVKKARKASKKEEAVLGVSNVIEKE